MPARQVALDTAEAGGVAAWAVQGALRAVADDHDLRVQLVGPEDDVRAVLPSDVPSGIEVVASGPAVDPQRDPAVAVRAQRDASVRVAADLLATGSAQALVTVAPIAAAVTVAAFALRRLPGLRHPALAATVEAGEHRLVVADAGAADATTAGGLVRLAELAAALHPSTAPRVGLLAPRGGLEGGLRDALALLGGALADGPVRSVGAVTARRALHGEVDVLVAPGSQGALLLDVLRAVGGARVHPAAWIIGVDGSIAIHTGAPDPDELATTLAAVCGDHAVSPA